MSKKKANKQKEEKAAATTAEKQLREYPAVEEFTIALFKELRAEFEDLLQSKANPERLAELRELGKRVQTYLKAKAAAPSENAEKDNPAPKAKKGLSEEEIEFLCKQMNTVMSIVPCLDPKDGEIMSRISAELQDLNLSDFYPNADHPEKKVFNERAVACIRRLGITIPGEGRVKKQARPPAAKKEFPSARQILYRAWMAGEKDVKKLAELVNESIKTETIRTYLSDWSHGKYLPAGVQAPKMVKGKAVTK